MAQTSMDDPEGEWGNEFGRARRDSGGMIGRREDGRREIYDRMLIDPLIDTAAALHRMPAHWLAAACRKLSIEPVDRSGRNRRVRSAALLSALFSTRRLAAVIADLPARSLYALRVVLESGGCVALIMLTQEFGEMDGDGWSWDEHPPVSCLGELRCRALLHIGRLCVEQDGGLPDLYVPIAVVPQDLRVSLCTLLGVHVEQAFTRLEPAPVVDDLQAALGSVQRYFDQPDAALGLTREDLADFLRVCAAEGRPPGMVWQHINLLLEFAAHSMHEIVTAEDLCGFHLSELATDFVDRRQGRRWLLAHRRDLISTVARLYMFLRERRLASDDVHDEIVCAAQTLLSGRRRLNLIRRPIPLGGEPVFMYDDESPAGSRIYTINHRRVAVAWWTLYDQDWDALLMRCDVVVDGHRKAQIARELMSVDASVCDLLLACAEEDELEFVESWFDEEPVLLIRAW